MTDRLPTEDEQTGMNWWNSLSEETRKFWFKATKATSIAEFWAHHKSIVQERRDAKRDAEDRQS